MATGDALLALLILGPRHGYDLKRAYDDWFSGLRPMAFGQVYSTLSRLQRDDLIQVAQTETAEGPERTVYELTSVGRTRAQEWLSEPVDPDVPGGAPADELIRKTLAAIVSTPIRPVWSPGSERCTCGPCEPWSLGPEVRSKASAGRSPAITGVSTWMPICDGSRSRANASGVFPRRRSMLCSDRSSPIRPTAQAIS